MKKLRGIVLMLLISLSLFGLTACQDGGNKATYEQITPQQAKEIMDTEQEYIKIAIHSHFIYITKGNNLNL